MVLPSGITAIEWYTFTGCTSLESVVYTGSADDFMKIAVTWGGEVDEESSIADRFDLSAIHYNYVPEN